MKKRLTQALVVLVVLVVAMLVFPLAALGAIGAPETLGVLESAFETVITLSRDAYCALGVEAFCP